MRGINTPSICISKSIPIALGTWETRFKEGARLAKWQAPETQAVLTFTLKFLMTLSFLLARHIPVALITGRV
jgi:hypothetical protein